MPCDSSGYHVAWNVCFPEDGREKVTIIRKQFENLLNWHLFILCAVLLLEVPIEPSNIARRRLILKSGALIRNEVLEVVRSWGP